MLKMSFYDGSLDTDTLIELVKVTKKPIKYTYGLVFRNPTTYKVPVTVERAIEIIKTQSLLDAEEYDDYVHLHAYSANDMW